jgi:hypothetical protein
LTTSCIDNIARETLSSKLVVTSKKKMRTEKMRKKVFTE